MIIELSNSSRNVTDFPPLEAIRVLALERGTAQAREGRKEEERSAESARRRCTEWELVLATGAKKRSCACAQPLWAGKTWR